MSPAQSVPPNSHPRRRQDTQWTPDGMIWDEPKDLHWVTLASSRAKPQAGQNTQTPPQHQIHTPDTYGARHFVCRCLCRLPLEWVLQVALPPDLHRLNHSINTGQHGNSVPFRPKKLKNALQFHFAKTWLWHVNGTGTPTPRTVS